MILNKILIKVVSARLIKGINLGKDGVHLQFADATILFTQPM